MANNYVPWVMTVCSFQVVVESSQSLDDVNEKLRDKLETSEPKSTSFQNNAQTVDKDNKVETQTLSKDDKNSQVIEDTRTNSENSDSKTKDKSDDSSQVKEGKKDDKTSADGESVESKKEKQKAKRKEYAKYSITNSADYKIRKKLDEADKLLDEVGILVLDKMFIFNIKRVKKKLLVKPRIFFRFSGEKIKFYAFERQNAFQMHKIIFFPEKKKNVCLPYLKFSDPLP